MPFTAKGIKKLAAHHGLDPEVNSDDDIDTQIKNAVTDDEMEDLANRAVAGDAASAELTALRESIADTDLKTYANRIGTDKDVVASWRNDLMSNRDIAIKKLEAIPLPATRQAPLHNRQTAKTPAELEADKGSIANRKLAREMSNRAKALQAEARAVGQKLDWNTAFKNAQIELTPAS